MHCNYLDQDFEARMNGGLAFYKGQPVILEASRGLISLSQFPSRDHLQAIEKDDPDLDLASPRLGYVNLQYTCLYVYRKPERKYKQTLTYGAIGWYDPLDDKNTRHAPPDIFYSPHFRKMLLNDYPSLDAVVKNLNSPSKTKSRALSRNICLAIDSFGIIRVYYKMEEVGYINPGETTVRVPNGTLSWVVSKYLKEFSWQVD